MCISLNREKVIDYLRQLRGLKQVYNGNKNMILQRENEWRAEFDRLFPNHPEMVKKVASRMALKKRLNGLRLKLKELGETKKDTQEYKACQKEANKFSSRLLKIRAEIEKLHVSKDDLDDLRTIEGNLQALYDANNEAVAEYKQIRSQFSEEIDLVFRDQTQIFNLRLDKIAEIIDILATVRIDQGRNITRYQSEIYDIIDKKSLQGSIEQKSEIVDVLKALVIKETVNLTNGSEIIIDSEFTQLVRNVRVSPFEGTDFIPVEDMIVRGANTLAKKRLKADIANRREELQDVMQKIRQQGEKITKSIFPKDSEDVYQTVVRGDKEKGRLEAEIKADRELLGGELEPPNPLPYQYPENHPWEVPTDETDLMNRYEEEREEYDAMREIFEAP